VQLSGKDTACDLARGRLTLHARASASAELSLGDQVAAKSYYLGLSEIGEGVTSQYVEPLRRAAALGFRLGRYFSQASPQASDDAIDMMIDGALDAYFNGSTLDLNSLWEKDLSGHEILDFEANSSPSPVQIDITANSNP
jgi:hypothetical protein